MNKRDRAKMDRALSRAPAVGTCPLAPPRAALVALVERWDVVFDERQRINAAIVRASVELGEMERSLEQREKDYLEAFFRAEDAERREQVLLRELGRL